ncbi:olfactory receptor 5AP2-like [Lithobates pipiens]
MIQSSVLKGTGNYSKSTAFLLLGLTNDPHLQLALFNVFLIMYLVTLMGNVGIILIIHFTSSFHTPMYIFLSHLAFTDICYASAVVPTTMVNLITQNRYISGSGCAVQLFMFSSFGSTECLLFGVMAYDRYVAICNPLYYGTIMTIRMCNILFATSYIFATVQAAIQTGFTFSLYFCGSNIIDHFICDALPLLRLSCSKTTINEIIISVSAAIIGGGSLFIIVTSYFWIATTVIKIPSSQGKRKAFSTCASHLVCVTLFYGTVLFNYLHPSGDVNMRQDVVASIFYTMVIPMLNPLIYSLRNTEVRRTCHRFVTQRVTFHLFSVQNQR